MYFLRRGFTLVDVIVGTALMLVLFLALFGILRASLEVSALAKAKATAIEVASTQIEYMRGLSYDSLGTVGGIPAGTIPQLATSTVDGVPYVTHTYVEYYDDPADGIGVSDTNGVTTDYKTAKITVTYSLSGIIKSVVLVSNFVPLGIEATTGGGTLSIHVVNANGANVSDASVQIVNASTSPAVNFTTFSDTSGLVMIGGAATSSVYQIFVSRSGYSSAQTYARTNQNVNPTPGYLTVAKNQTTSATFAIDLLTPLTLSSFAVASTTTFTDAFTSASNLASQTNTQVSGGALTLASNVLSGSANSIPIAPNALDGWGILSATMTTPDGTSAVVHVDDASGNLIPDSALPNNSIGFSSFPVSLTGLATSSYPILTLEADLTTSATTTTPSITGWSLSHTEGPFPLPNIAFTLTGAKTIGTDGSGLPIYKTTMSDTTGATATKTEQLEWDSYTLALTSATLIESCPTTPYPLVPGQATSTALTIGTLSTNTLPIIINDSTDAAVSNAKVILTKSGYAATVITSPCGLAFFNSLASGTYSATVSAAGHTTTVFPNISVAGHTAASTFTLP